MDISERGASSLAAQAERAREARFYGDALGEAGFDLFGRMLRNLSRDVLELAAELEGERSARLAMQANYERAIGVLADQAGRATLPDAFRERARAAVEAEAILEAPVALVNPFAGMVDIHGNEIPA